MLASSDELVFYTRMAIHFLREYSNGHLHRKVPSSGSDGLYVFFVV